MKADDNVKMKTIERFFVAVLILCLAVPLYFDERTIPVLRSQRDAAQTAVKAWEKHFNEVTDATLKTFSALNSPGDVAEMLARDAREYNALTNLCELLVLSGDFCRIRDHAWVANLKGYPAEQVEKPEWRECLVCGREEERARPNKPWHHSNP